MPATTFKGGGTGQTGGGVPRAQFGSTRLRSRLPGALDPSLRPRHARAAAPAHKLPRAENPSPRTAGRTADAA
jgi:hypothetical protein